MKNKKLFAILTLVCFMMTLMPVAAFAADAVADTSAFVAVDGEQTLRVNTETGVTTAQFMFKGNTNGETTGDVPDKEALYVWAVDANGVKTSALEVAAENTGVGATTAPQYVKGFTGVKDGYTFKVSFARAGVYTVYAGFGKVAAESMSDITTLNAGKTVDTITVVGTSTNPSTTYRAALEDDYTKSVNYLTDLQYGYLTPNNIGKEVTVSFFRTSNAGTTDALTDDDYKKLTGKTVTIETNSANITVDKATATTNVLGQIKFNVAAAREGEYEIYLTIDGVTFIVNVTSTNTSAAYIETISQPKAPKAQYEGLPTLRFMVTDINGNVVKGERETTNANGKTTGVVPTNKGMEGIRNNVTGYDGNKAGSYVVLTEKPSASSLTSTDLGLIWNADKQAYDLTANNKIMDAEGTYAVKVILDNGAYATAKWEVKKFQTPVQMRIDYARTTVELGGKIAPEQIVYVDVNGVEKQATDSEFAATGYAIYNLTGRTITVKTDEKYVGAKIDVTAVSERYDLVTTAELTVADAAKDIAFADKTAEVNVNNKILWNVVDSQGNKVALDNSISKTEIKYVVLDKPEGAKVSTYDATIDGDLKAKGEGKMALTSDKIGNVTVQVVLKAEYVNKTANDNTTVGNTATSQTKYYSGTQIFAVGNGSVGDVVVMSVGSNEIVINDKKAAIDAAPIVKNDRTFVPFRALAEAFGAEVAYDEATQAVTAELNGVKVVMTIGSATYTVNGAEKTMDVAPFINGSRTMVPVRFVAESFGIKVIPTYDENGATADILFNL